MECVGRAKRRRRFGSRRPSPCGSQVCSRQTGTSAGARAACPRREAVQTRPVGPSFPCLRDLDAPAHRRKLGTRGLWLGPSRRGLAARAPARGGRLCTERNAFAFRLPGAMSRRRCLRRSAASQGADLLSHTSGRSPRSSGPACAHEPKRRSAALATALHGAQARTRAALRGGVLPPERNRVGSCAHP